MNIEVELDLEQVSRMVYQDLKETRECFLEDLENDNPCVFSHSEIYDKITIIEHIKALDLILEWYRDPSA